MKVSEKEFYAMIKMAIDDLIVIDGDIEKPTVAILNYKGVHNITNVTELSAAMYVNEEFCLANIDIGLTKRRDINELYVVCGSRSLQRYDKFVDCKYRLPISLMGRQI